MSVKISDILKIKWVRDEEFPEKWYDSEIFLHVIAKNNNPFAAIFTKRGLNVLIINNTLYSESGEDLIFWDEDRKNAAKDLKTLCRLVQEQQKYIKKAEKFANSIKSLKIINENNLKEIKKIFNSLWCIFLSDLGKPFALEVEKKLKGKNLKQNQIEKIKDYLSGLEKKLPLKKLLDKNIIKFLKLVNKSILIDNYAADLYSQIDSILSGFLYKKFSISREDLSMYSFSDLEILIKNETKLNVKDLKERENFRIMAQINGDIIMLYGKKSFEKIMSILQNNIKVNVNNVSGIVASKGIAKGYVKIVRTIKDMDKVKRGDIVVASTTRPELMPALRRCAAIVIDTGGITSHAAIISRELKKPCIVGTKFATQILKDGDLVEVDADKGIVRILK